MVMNTNVRRSSLSVVVVYNTHTGTRFLARAGSIGAPAGDSVAAEPGEPQC